MNDPESEITGIIQTLCTARPSIQRKCIETYFTPTASFTHPFCRTGSFNGSRWLVIQIYRWYKILSPVISVTVDSISFDEANMILYVSVRQIFKIPVIPFYRAEPTLVTVLRLTTNTNHYGGTQPEMRTSSTGQSMEPYSESPSELEPRRTQSGNAHRTPKKYYIQSQNDLYQTTEWIKFVMPWGVGFTVLVVLQLWATLLCVVCAAVGWPITWLRENIIGGNLEQVSKMEVLGPDRKDSFEQ